MKKLILILLILFPLVTKAQESSPASWNASFYIGPVLGGVPRNIQNEMKKAGFKEVPQFIDIGLGSGMARNGRVIQARFERKTKNPWSYSLLLSTYNGYVKGESPYYGRLHIEHTQLASSFLVGYNFNVIRFAAGPSLHYTTLENPGYSSPSPYKDNTFKAGFAVEAGLRFPAKSRIFFDFNTQYQYVGKQNLGTYNFFEPVEELQLSTKPANYLCFNIGLGIRFGKIVK
ncbi:hypothetical protein BH23BAC1_BH23BAC1_31600 [soil metagenome]